MDILGDNRRLNNLGLINVVLGKNGAGKSTILKHFRKAKNELGDDVITEYITPERGGVLKYQSNVDQNITNSPDWLTDTRFRNQAENFKQQTISRYQAFEMTVLRTIAYERREDKDYSFEKYIEKINELLDNVQIRSERTEKSFSILKKGTNEKIAPDEISSGESELIALAIECLHFQQSVAKIGLKTVLMLDEPDVHLHPDLQVKFMRFIHSLVIEARYEFQIIIATHSTALLGAIENMAGLHIGFMSPGKMEIDFTPVTEMYQKFLPIFGAHPLSSVFNEAPILLVEGDDDERIWQQAVRSSKGKIKIYPCVCGDNVQITAFETVVKDVLKSVYDAPKAYSLRDRDTSDESDLPDEAPIIKLRLKCYSAENLLLSNEALASLGKSWPDAISALDEWIDEKRVKSHPQLKEMLDFQASGYDRKNRKVKFLRNLLLGILGSSKPWEVIVGQTIANLKWDSTTTFAFEGSIYNYLGEKLVKTLLKPS